MKTIIPEKMKKQKLQPIYALIAFVLLSACTSAPGSQENDKRELLNQYKQQVHELNTKIDELEKELSNGESHEQVAVVTTKLAPEKFEHFIEVRGNVEADKEINVSPEGSGQILEIHVKEGQWVEEGTTLATLNAEPIDRNIDQVRINLDLANTTFERQKKLWDQNIGSEMQYLQAKSAKEALEKQLESLIAQKDMSIIKAPIAGSIDVIFQKEGQIASPQIPFAKLVNINEVKIYADVAESYLTKIKEGDQVWVNFPALSRNVKTKISMIGNYIDPGNRTFRVRLDLSNRDRLIKPNLDAVVKLRDYVAEEAIVIPSLLVKSDFKGQYTFVAEKSKKDHIARKVYITTGVSDNNMSEITEGLQSGMLVISEGFNQVFDGAHVSTN